MKKIVVVFFLLVAVCGFSQANETASNATIVSPTKKVKVEFFLTADGQPSYRTYFNNKVVVANSLLGFELKDAPALEKNFKVISAKQTSFDETWEQPWGEEHFIKNNYNQLAVALEEKTELKRKLNIVFRVYDDGIGFRYEFPEQAKLKSLAITNELTEFNMTGNHTSWWTPALAGNQFEYLYSSTPISQIGLVHTPLTMKTSSGVYLSIHEAALHNFSSMVIDVKGGAQKDVANKNGIIKLHAGLVPLTKHTNVKAVVDAPFVTPWRTVQIANTPGDLITSYLILNLNEPNKLGDVSWVKPGKYVGVWWELHLEKGTWKQGPKHGANTANVKKYIDFAAKYGFGGVLVEGWNEGWDGEWWNKGGNDFNFTKAYPDYDVNELSRYAKEKGVYIIGHHETGAATENYESQLEDAYQFLEDHGMKAVKTGYVETGEVLMDGRYHHGQYFVNHQQKVIDMAAKHHIMLVAHETIKDTGERRTYPNFLSRECARGQEYNAWAKDGGNPPNHLAILPFTRFLSGPMDFTPGIFELTLPNREKIPGKSTQVNSTLVNQLALYVVLYSPVQMAADLLENYEQHLDAFQFIRDVPTDWETTRVLSGEIGEFVTIARKQRSSDRWFVGGVTNENARTTKINLGFLDAGKKYKARIYTDAKDNNYVTNPGAYAIEERSVTAKDVIDVRMAAAGGLAISLIPE